MNTRQRNSRWWLLPLFFVGALFALLAALLAAPPASADPAANDPNMVCKWQERAWDTGGSSAILTGGANSQCKANGGVVIANKLQGSDILNPLSTSCVVEVCWDTGGVTPSGDVHQPGTKHPNALNTTQSGSSWNGGPYQRPPTSSATKPPTTNGPISRPWENTGSSSSGSGSSSSGSGSSSSGSSSGSSTSGESTTSSGTTTTAPADKTPIDDVDAVIPDERGICDPKGSFGDRFDVDSWAKGCMPVYRWKDAASSFHSDLPSGAMNWLRYTPGIMTQEMVMSVGNALWSATVAATEWASSLNPIERAGLQIDTMAASLGNALLESPLLAGVVVAGILAALWGAWRGRGMSAWKDVLRVLLVVGLMAGMVVGATESHKGQMRPDNHGQQYTPTIFGKFSPSWFASTLSNIINSTSDQIATAILVEDYPSEDPSDQPGAQNCETYRLFLKETYAEALGGRPTAIPLALSAAWERTGLAAWKVNQFGYNRDLEDSAYCHLLEWNAGIRGKDQYNIFKQAPTGWPELPKDTDANLVLSFNPALSADDGDEDDSYVQNTSHSLVGWAACEPADNNSVKMKEDWEKAFAQGQGSQTKDCVNWWEKENHQGKKGTALAIKRSPNQIMGALPGYKAGQDYVGFMQGSTRISAMSTPFIYVLSALVNLVVFGGLALTVAIASVGVAVLAAVSLLALFISTMPGRVGTEVPKRFLKMWISYTLVAWSYSSIMALVVVITSLLDNMAMGSVGGYGSAGNMLIAALTPLAAVFVLKQFFTKLVGMPNPFSLKNAVAAAGLGTVARVALGMGKGAAGLAGRLTGRGKGKGKGGAKSGGPGGGSQAESGPGAPQEKGMAAAADRQREPAKASAGGMGDVLPQNTQEEGQFKRWKRTQRAQAVGAGIGKGAKATARGAKVAAAGVGRGAKATGKWAAASTLGVAGARVAKGAAAGVRTAAQKTAQQGKRFGNWASNTKAAAGVQAAAGKAKALGVKATHTARHVGGKVAAGAKVAGGKVAAGAKVVGAPIGRAASAAGGAVASAAKGAWGLHEKAQAKLRGTDIDEVRARRAANIAALGRGAHAVGEGVVRAGSAIGEGATKAAKATAAGAAKAGKATLRSVAGVDMDSDEWKEGSKLHRAMWTATGVGGVAARAAAVGAVGTAAAG